MSRAVRWVLAVVALLAAAAAVPQQSRESALERARQLRARVSGGDLGDLWPEMTPHLQEVLKDSASFVAMSNMIHAQIGDIDSVMQEEFTDSDTLRSLVSRCRVSRVKVPMVVSVTLTGDGRIAGMRVRPEAAEYPSPHLDYVSPVHFRLPFDGEWTVGWGGRTLTQNYHAAVRSQRFAYDLVMMRDSSTHTGDGKALTDYHCYGQRILAPAAGTVVSAVDSLPDQPIGGRDPLNAAGNHVVLQVAPKEYLLLAHLQPHSLRVKPGARVKPGQWLGLAGNSGNTSQPHLHVHLMDGPAMPDADGLPLAFERYLANDTLVARGEPVRHQRIRQAR